MSLVTTGGGTAASGYGKSHKSTVAPPVGMESWKVRLDARISELEHKVCGDDSLNAVRFSEKTTYYFFHSPVDKFGSIHKMSDTAVADGEFLRQLNSRLDYYLNYRIKDLKDDKLLVFRKAFLVGGKFYMQMSAENPSVTDRVRSYRLDYKDENGRDIFKVCTPAEQREIEDYDCQWESKLINVDAEQVRATFITELEYQNQYYVVFRYTRDFISTFERRLQALDAKASGTQEMADLRGKVKSVDNHINKFQEKTSDDIHRLEDELNAIIPQFNTQLEEFQQDMTGKIDRDTENRAFAVNRRLNEFESRLGPLPEAVESYDERVSLLENEYRGLANVVAEALPQHAEKTSYFFYETPVDANGQSMRMNEEPVVDPDHVNALQDRLDYYQGYRVKDLADNSVLKFVKGFFANGRFFMTMSNDGGNDPAKLRVYRLDRKDEHGRDIYKNASQQERMLIQDGAANWDTKVLKVDGEFVRTHFVTEIELDGRFFVVFKYTRDMQAALEKRLSLLESSFCHTNQRVKDNIDTLRTREDEVDRRFKEMHSEFDDALNNRCDGIQVDITELHSRQREGSSVIALIKERVQQIEQSQLGLNELTSAQDGRLRTLEEELRLLESVIDEVRAAMPAAEVSPYYFFELSDEEGRSKPVTADLPVEDEAVLASLAKRLDYYKSYRIKDLADSTILSFMRAFYLNHRFYMVVTNPDNTAIRRSYRLDSKDTAGRDVFLHATPQEKAMIDAADTEVPPKTIEVGDASVRLTFETEIELNTKFYSVFKSETVPSRVQGLEQLLEGLQRRLMKLEGSIGENLQQKLEDMQRELQGIEVQLPDEARRRLEDVETINGDSQTKLSMETGQKLDRMSDEQKNQATELGQTTLQMDILAKELLTAREVVHLFFFRLSLSESKNPNTKDATMVEEPRLVEALTQRLKLLRDYRVREIKDAAVLAFQQAVLLDGKFFLLVKNSKTGVEKAYVATAKEGQRDVFSPAKDEELKRLLDLRQSRWENAITTVDVAGVGPRKTTLITELENEGQYYVCFSTGKSLESRLTDLEHTVHTAPKGDPTIPVRIGEATNECLVREAESKAKLQEGVEDLKKKKEDASLADAEQVKTIDSDILANEAEKENLRKLIQENSHKCSSQAGDNTNLITGLDVDLDALAERIKALEDAVGEATASDLQDYFFFPISSKDDPSPTIPETPDMSPEKQPGLQAKLAGLLKYRVRGLKEAAVFSFMTAFFMNGQFFYKMHQPEKQLVNYYRLKSSLNDRDTFGNPTEEEKAAIETRVSPYPENMSFKLDSPKAEVTATFVTEMLLNDQPWAVFKKESANVLAVDDLNTRVNALAHRVADNKDEIATLANTLNKKTKESLDDLNKRVSSNLGNDAKILQYVTPLGDDLKAIKEAIDKLKAKTDDVSKVADGAVAKAGELENNVAASDKAVDDLTDKLSGVDDAIKDRLAPMTEQNKALKDTVDAILPHMEVLQRASMDEKNVVFYKIEVTPDDLSPRSVKLSSEPVPRNEDLHHQLHDRLNMFIHHRMTHGDKTTGEKVTYYFDHAFVVKDKLCVDMADLGGTKPNKLFRREKNPQGGDAWKFGTADELAVRDTTKVFWPAKRLKMDEVTCDIAFVTEMEFQDSFYAAFIVQDTVQRRLKALEDKVDSLNVLVANVGDRTQHQEDVARVAAIEEKLADGSQTEETASKLDAMFAETQKFALKSAVDPALLQLDQWVHQILTLKDDMSLPEGPQTMFFPVLFENGIAKAESDQHVTDEALLKLLKERLAYFKGYQIKDLTDGAKTKFDRGYLIDGHFYLEMKSVKGDVRYYRRDATQSSGGASGGRDKFKKCSEAEVLACNALDVGLFNRTLSLPNGQGHAFGVFETQIVAEEKYYTVLTLTNYSTHQDRLKELETSIARLTATLGVGHSLMRSRVAKLEHDVVASAAAGPGGPVSV